MRSTLWRRHLQTWLIENRASPRAAFGLRMICMVAGVAMSLYWSRTLLHVLGVENFGLFTSFASFLALLGAGDLGLGGGIGVRTGQLLALGNDQQTSEFHAVARTCVWMIGVTGAAILLLLAPWLPHLLHFDPQQARGSLVALFAVAAPSFAIGIYASYLANSSYAAGTVTWDIIPSFLLGQLVWAAQVFLSRLAAPLWLLQVSAVVLSLLGVGVMQTIYRYSHPVFARKLPRSFNAQIFLDLVKSSFWVYCFSLALVLYNATDRLIVNAQFGAVAVPVFQFNSRLTELALSVTVAAGYVGIPKIVHALLAPAGDGLVRGKAYALYLMRLQSFLCVGATLLYLLVNDFFIQKIYGDSFVGSPILQGAFGTILILWAHTDVYLQVTTRSSPEGQRLAGLAVLGTAIFNLSLSVVAARYLHSMAAVAWSTSIALAVLYFIVSEHVRRKFDFGSFALTSIRTFLAPLTIYALGYTAKAFFPISSLGSGLLLSAIYVIMLLLYSLCAGPSPREMMGEFRSMRARFVLGR